MNFLCHLLRKKYAYAIRIGTEKSILGGSWYLKWLLNCFACLYLNKKNTSLLSFKEVFLFLFERCY